jgi:hypothetical protein
MNASTHRGVLRDDREGDMMPFLRLAGNLRATLDIRPRFTGRNVGPSKKCRPLISALSLAEGLVEASHKRLHFVHHWSN